jgi:hypothetical protein
LRALGSCSASLSIFSCEQEPKALKPFERELVTYLISSVSGAKVFKNHDPCPPATWINVFDKERRCPK